MTDPIEQNTQPPSATPVEKEQKTFLGQTTRPAVVSSDLEKVRQSSLNEEDDLPDGPVELPTVELNLEYTTAVQDLHERKDLSMNKEILIFASEVSKNADMRIRRHFTPGGLNTKRGRDWNEALVSAATSTTLRDSRLTSTVSDPNASWKQYLQTEATKIGFSAPTIKESGTPYTGEKAMLRVRSLLGMGGIISVPLYHSGFWVTMTAPTDGELIELRRRLMQEKIDLGRMTFGLLFSNEQSYLNSWMFEFCMDHLYDTTARVDNPAVELRNLIKTQDLNILFWGMARLIWPRGFDYVRPLTTVEGVENYQLISAKIDIGKLLWVDNNSFSKEASALLSRRQRSSVSVDEIKSYQEKFLPSLSAGRRVEVTDDIAIIIASPSVDKYIEDGDVWISNIIKTVDDTFTTALPDEAARSLAIESHSRAARLRNYGSWVKAVVIEGNEVTEEEVIWGTLEVLSQDDNYSKIVKDAIDKFIDDSTRALIAVPATSGKESGIPRFANLIPLDVINAFFTLLAQRVGIISRR